ncbi:MAG: nicotinamide-nucleotide amidohydrolase family protein [bacterium]
MTKETRIFRTIGLSEDRIRRMLEDLTKWGKSVSIELKSTSFGVDIELIVESENASVVSSLTKGAEDNIKKRLASSIYGIEKDSTLERVLGYLLYLNKLTLGIAESCSGGLASHLVTNVPGASSYFKGGIIAYSNYAKIEVLGVSSKTIERFGAISKKVAEEMAIGVKRLLKTDLGLSITGIAGPSGETKEKPLGLVYIGLAKGDDVMVKDFLFAGEREQVKEQSAYYAFDLVRRALIK